ncbi:MAG: hypothetical protein HY744_29895 [Deltaproteobacteria bacterium]|nr:hypothetical protein [Deltaproteobacteria bacterium]
MLRRILVGGAAPRPGRRQRAVRAARIGLLSLLLLGAAVLFAAVVHRHYPLEKWLFWRYAGYWLACLVWSLGCVSVGHLVVRRFLGRTLPVAEQLATSFAVGVVAFFLLMFGAGALGLFRAPLFYALPLGMIALGGPALYRYLRRAARRLGAYWRRAPRPPFLHYAVLAFGLAGVAMVYFVVLAPEHAQFDARWKHLALAEDYWATGAVRRFPEGWTVATYPHLVSFLFTWGFLVPGGRLFDQVELCAHMEVTVFLFTLLGVVGLVRLLVPRCHGELAWAARFLFPGVFLYDSSLATGADHIGALFAVPIFTLLVRAWRELSPGPCALLAAMMSGAALVKYTSAIMLFPVPAAVLGLRALWLLWRRRRVPAHMRGNWYRGPLAALAVGLAVTAPHWLKNVVWYGDPFYPVLYKHLALRPWIGQDGADMYEWGYQAHQFWRPSRDWQGLRETFTALFDFSFVPNDYKRYHGEVPVFGSLFTLLLAPLVFLRARPFVAQRVRLWGVVLTVHGGILVWYWTHHQDRYLQVLLPLMTAITAACIALLWRTHAVTRGALVLLVGLQIVWGGDVYFIQSHAMIKSPIKKVNDLLEMGYRRQYDKRFEVFGSYGKLRELLPAKARVLLHDNHDHVGIGRSSVSDWQGWQYGINYGRLAGPRAVCELLRGMGVTHLVWAERTSKGWDSLAGDIMFFEFATRYGERRRRAGSLELADMPAKPPPEHFADTVAVLGCKQGYRTGLYRVGQLAVPVFGPRRARFPKPILEAPDDAAGHAELMRRAAFAAVDRNCQAGLPAGQRGSFRLIAERRPQKGDRRTRGGKPTEIWSRVSGVAEPLP